MPTDATLTTDAIPRNKHGASTVIETVAGQRVPLIPPDYVDESRISLTENSRKVLERRYLRRDLDGALLETPGGMFYRVAYHIAQVEKQHGLDPEEATEAFYKLMSEYRFFPNSPTFTGAGTPLGQLAACFVLPIEDDMGKRSDGIFSTLRVAALIQQTGGGNGFSFSRLRPKGDVVHTSAGRATGPVGFLRVYDQAFGEIAQGGTRRGANMGVLRVDHPDIEEFIECKAKEGAIANFNISVAITDEFMQAVKDDADFALRNPRNGEVSKVVRARDLFAKIIKYAHHNGEPGALFIDAANRSNPVPHLYALEATNPCVTGDTLVATPQGWRRADSIQVGDEICTVLGTGRVAEVEVNPQIQVYDVYLSDGGIVRATAAHQFHVRDSRTKFYESRRLDQIKPGDWVRVYPGTVPNNSVTPTAANLTDQEYGFLVGLLVGDGCYTPQGLAKNVVRVSSHAYDAQWNEIIEASFAKIGATAVRSYVNPGSHSMMLDPKPGHVVAAWVRSLPLEPARSYEKRLPEAYINSNREFLVGLLDGLFSTDGSVDLQSNHPVLRFHTASLELARQVRRILLMFGIHARIATSERKRHDINGRFIRNDRPKHDVVISGASLGRFFEQIRLSHPNKQMRLEEAALRSNFTGGNWAAKVLKIEPAGLATVYDLYEPRSDTWITEGYVSRGCGEQWLGPYENCCLGSINLGVHVTTDANGKPVVDWDLLRRSVYESTHFLDNVVSANAYVPAVPEVAEAAYRARRIGLGIMGLGDMMYKLGIRYGSEEGQEFAGQIMEFVRYHCMEKSIELAAQRGPFLAYEGSIYDPKRPGGMQWQPPTPLFPFRRDWGRPALDWSRIVQGIHDHGIRNAAQTTVAPTGTIATVCGCEGYGCEPVFALGYIRHFKDGDRDVELVYTSPLFEQALNSTSLGEARKNEIKQHVATVGSCQDVDDLPDAIRHTFVVSSDITAEEHVRMQAAIQAFVDNSISKCVTGDTLLLTAGGLTPIRELSDLRLPDQFAPLELDIISPAGRETARQFYYGGYRETIKVTLNYGFAIEGTGNHRIHVLAEDGSIQFRRLDELKLNDTVVLYGNQQQFGPAGQPLPRYSGACQTNSKAITFPSAMSEALAFFLGCVTAAGTITGNGLSITNHDVALLEELNASSARLFGLRGTIVADKRNQVHSLQINSRPLRNWLLADLGLEAGAENKVVPLAILRASKGEVAAFLRGLLLDGYMTLDGRLFGITLASARLIRQLQIMLLNMGVVATARQVTERAWNLAVQGAELEALAGQISFVEVWKNERLARRNVGRVKSLRNYSRLLPVGMTQALRAMQAQSGQSLRSVYQPLEGVQEREYQRVRVNLLAGHRLQRPDALRLYRRLSQDTAHPVADTFFGHDSAQKLYVSVQGLETGYAEVFDIHVPGSHSFIGNGLGNHNTCNFPEDATEDDVAKAYMLAWELGCKGLTVYVTGTRQEVVLETKATKEKKGEGSGTAVVAAQGSETPYTNGASSTPAVVDVKPIATKRPRPAILNGSTYRKETPLGTAYITVNSDDRGEPFEIFLNVGKAGSEVSAVSEAIGRLISLVLRMPGALPPTERLRWIMDEMAGIGGGRPLGFGANRVRSLPDGIAQVLADHLSGLPPVRDEQPAEQLALPIAQRPIGDICPECGEAAFLNVEGCRKCAVCGYSEC
ncbi:MAG TPA: LAGLIDADG family homing endonuclease [Caldilineaceae bacterium]|nr:LAGLIDADG family homing endonuclease [Caldilineaceae bacterium]